MGLLDKQQLSMAFKKGRSGNPQGRPLDSSTQLIREGLKSVLDFQKLESALMDLQGIQYIQAVSKMLPYLLPRLQEVVVVNLQELQQSIQTLPDKDIASLSQQLIDEYERRRS